MNVSFAKTSCDSLKTQDGGVSLLEIYAREAFVVFLYDFQFRFMFFSCVTERLEFILSA